MNRTLLGLAVASAAAATGFSATSANADVYIYRPYPAYVYPRLAGPVIVAPAYPVVATPHCVWRTMRVWVNGHYVSRRVRTCW